MSPTDTPDREPEAAAHRRSRSGRRRMLGALGGVGLLGAVLALAHSPVGGTLASYKDREFASASYTGSQWNVQSSADYSGSGGTWKDNNTTPATLTVSPTSIRPGKNAYSRFSLRMAQGSVAAATISLGAGTVTSDSSNVASNYKVRITTIGTSTTCDSSAFPTGANSGKYLLGEYNSTPAPTAAPTTTTFPLAASTSSAPGTASSVCLEFGVNDVAAVNGTTITVVWPFKAKSS